jgi:hypothetical protein
MAASNSIAPTKAAGAAQGTSLRVSTGQVNTGKADIPLPISAEQELSVIRYATTAQQLLINQFSLRSAMEEIDRNYMRENNYTEAQWRARLANRAGDAHKQQDPTVPVVEPLVRSALAYLANVFVTGYPVFGVAADPANEDAALQMQTIIAENAVYTGWTRELLMFLRDGLKYNMHGLEIDWEQRNTWDIETDISRTNGVKPKKTIWNGNVLRRMDLYNTFFDPRVSPADIHKKGEFAGYIEILSRVQMKQYFNDMFGKIPPETVIRALQSSPAGGSNISSMAPFAYYQPMINPEPLMNKTNLMGFDWMNWALGMEGKPNSIRYSNVYIKTRIYGRIIPADFGLQVPEKNTPQVWKFEIINGQVVCLAERMPNVHGWIPIIFGQPIEDGLQFQTKSYAKNVEPLQQISSAMISGYMMSKRRLIGDRVIYDPTRIAKKDINSINPAAKIPVRPSAYGKPLNEAVFPFPYRDEQTSSLLEGAQVMINYAERITGSNPAQQGQFVKGNKTLKEFDTTMGHSNDYHQLMAITTEQQVFIPLKEIIKLNILQFQGSTILFNRDKGIPVQIEPETLRKQAVHFKISDGELPNEELMSTDDFQAALQAVAQNPNIGSGYNLTPMFSYLMKVRSNVDLTPFQKSPLQMQFEQAMAQWQQVAEAAIKAGQPIPPQPQMPPELVAELQQKQQSGGATPSPTSQALESTQG